jgi:tRNA(fMet)-specific endonuclease VapC
VYVLDTDHISEFYVWETEAGVRLKARIQESSEPCVTSIITVEETMRGWMAQIRRVRVPTRLVEPYRHLGELFAVFADWTILPWDERAVEEFEELRNLRIRVASMDLMIAAITLAHDATLLTRNTRDFEKVPDLRFEDWLAE